MLSAGADGLIKLWGLRSSECLATFDEHEAKVWAMHVAGANDSLLVTGGADARVNVWRDCTIADEASAAAERTEAALKGQELANALQVGRTSASMHHFNTHPLNTHPFLVNIPITFTFYFPRSLHYADTKHPLNLAHLKIHGQALYEGLRRHHRLS